MGIIVPWGYVYALFTVSAFVIQYSAIINNWMYTELYRIVYWPSFFMLIPPAVVIYQMIVLDKPFYMALEHQVEQFCLYALALSGAWMIGRYKLIREGKWDVRVSFDEELERLISMREELEEKNKKDK